MTETKQERRKRIIEERMTEPGIVIAGETVIYDGEAAALGVEPLTHVPYPEGFDTEVEAAAG